MISPFFFYKNKWKPEFGYNLGKSNLHIDEIYPKALIETPISSKGQEAWRLGAQSEARRKRRLTNQVARVEKG